MNVIQESLNSYERMVDLGLLPTDKIWYRTYPEKTIKSPLPGRVGGLWIGMSLNRIVHSRTVYSIFDLLADVGGLSDILFQIGGMLLSSITFLTGSGLNRLLISSIFKTNVRKGPKKNGTASKKDFSSDGMKETIKSRVPLRVGCCKWWNCCDRTIRYQEKAEGLISKEIDIVRFIRR